MCETRLRAGVTIARDDDMRRLRRYETPHAIITMTPQATKDKEPKLNLNSQFLRIFFKRKTPVLDKAVGLFRKLHIYCQFNVRFFLKLEIETFASRMSGLAMQNFQMEVNQLGRIIKIYHDRIMTDGVSKVTYFVILCAKNVPNFARIH